MASPRTSDRIRFRGKRSLAALGIVTIAGFFLSGIVNAPLRRAQSSQAVSDAATPSFDVASIKQARADESTDEFTFEPGGRLVVRSYGLKFLILMAWHIPEFQLQGSSGWTETLRYDIDAEASGNPTHDQLLLMLQSLLIERFHLTVHHETEDLPIFVLRRESALGTDLAPTKPGSCTPTPVLQVVPPTAPGAKPLCGLEGRLVQLPDAGGPAMLMLWRGAPMGWFVRTLGTTLHRHVADDTNLAGDYNVRLEYRPDNFSGKATPIPGAEESTAPSIFTAVREQLGLKLDSEKGPVDVLVIDHAEAPTPN